MTASGELKNEALESSGVPLSGYRWVMAAGMVMSNWAMVIPALSFGILLPEIRQTFPMSDTQAGWLSSSVRIGNIVLILSSVFIFARLNPLRLFSATVLAGAVLTFVMASAVNFWIFAIARFAFGASASARTPARPLLTQQWFPLREIPKVQGLVFGLSGLAEFLALSMTPFLLSATGSWRAVLYIYGGVGSVIFIAWTLSARERITPDYIEKSKAPKNFSIGSVWRYRDLWYLGLGAFGVGFGWFVFSTFWPTYMHDTHGIPLKRTGAVIGTFSLAQVPAGLLMGLLAAKVRDRRPILVACGLGMAGALIGLTLVTQTWALVLLCLLGGSCWCFMPILLSIPYEIPGIDLSNVSAGIALVTTIHLAGGIVGPVAAGALSDGVDSLFAALIVSACMPVVLALACLPVRPYRRAV